MIIKDHILKNKFLFIFFAITFTIIFIIYSFTNNDYFILSENDRPFFIIPENKEGITIINQDKKVYIYLMKIHLILKFLMN